MLIQPLFRQTAAKLAETAEGWLLDSCSFTLDVGGAKGRRFGGRRRNCFGRHTPILQFFPKRQMEALLKKQARRLLSPRFFIIKSYCSFRPLVVLDFEPCRIRKASGFTHHGIRHISKKGYTSILVSELPRCLYNPFPLHGSKKMEVTGLEPVTLCL